MKSTDNLTRIVFNLFVSKLLHHDHTCLNCVLSEIDDFEDPGDAPMLFASFSGIFPCCTEFLM